MASCTVNSEIKKYTKTSRIKQIELEQDSGKSLHNKFVENFQIISTVALEVMYIKVIVK